LFKCWTFKASSNLQNLFHYWWHHLLQAHLLVLISQVQLTTYHYNWDFHLLTDRVKVMVAPYIVAKGTISENSEKLESYRAWINTMHDFIVKLRLHLFRYKHFPKTSSILTSPEHTDLAPHCTPQAKRPEQSCQKAQNPQPH
jgi:hypothetical protein